jgi:hypothetical protein
MRPVAGYTAAMRSVADRLREDSRRRLAEMTPEERLRLAFALGEADLALLQAAQALSAMEARERIARGRQVGRVPSCAARR